MKRRLTALRDDSGAALIMVIGWSMVLAMLVTAAVGYAISSTKVARNGQEWGSAQSAAMAGIEDYVSRLNRNDNYGRIWDCTNTALKGPNQPGNTCGWTTATAPGWLPVVGTDMTGPTFHYDVDASMLDRNGTITVTSTGRVGKETRTVQAAIGRGGSTDFLYYTDLEHADPANRTVYPSAPTKYFCGKNGAQKDIYWWSPSISGENRSNSSCTEIGFASGDVLDGRVHFNDTPKLNAAGTQFKAGFETGAPGCKTATAPNYAGCLRSGSPIPVLRRQADLRRPALPRRHVGEVRDVPGLPLLRRDPDQVQQQRHDDGLEQGQRRQVHRGRLRHVHRRQRSADGQRPERPGHLRVGGQPGAPVPVR